MVGRNVHPAMFWQASKWGWGQASLLCWARVGEGGKKGKIYHPYTRRKRLIIHKLLKTTISVCGKGLIIKKVGGGIRSITKNGLDRWEFTPPSPPFLRSWRLGDRIWRQTELTGKAFINVGAGGNQSSFLQIRDWLERERRLMICVCGKWRTATTPCSVQFGSDKTTPLPKRVCVLHRHAEGSINRSLPLPWELSQENKKNARGPPK